MHRGDAALGGTGRRHRLGRQRPARLDRLARHHTGHPPKRNRKVKLDRGHAIYKQRNVIERMFCCFNDWKRVAMRFDRNIKTFMVTIAVAATVIWRLK